MKVIVIGGGPAGMLSAISSAQNGNEVTVIEKMNSFGRKLLITGKGRCNITSSLEDVSDFIKNTPGNGKFLYSAFNNFTNKDIINLLNEQGVKVKNERGNRIFPESDKSLDVLKALVNKMKQLNVKMETNTKVNEILVQDKTAIGVVVQNKSGEIRKIFADKIILATGGKSYPATGSTGDGYKLAYKLGHTIVDIKPSLVPLEVKEKECKQMQGLSLKNVSIKILNDENKKIIYQDFGEMVFTHYGISGPIILSGSAHLLRVKNIEELLKRDKIKIEIDLKPALTVEKLDFRILRDFEQEKNKQFKNSINKLLPQKLIPVIIKLSKIDANKQVNEITKTERQYLVELLKKLTFTITKFRPIDEAIITAGGISTKEINPKTMESRIIKSLYFAGEIIDVDAYTGGFNLQIAYSTGFTAGMN